jgi:MoxR-like ATPase
MAKYSKKCDACGAVVAYDTLKGFKPAHKGCPAEGTNAADPEHPACPVHGTLVWTVGPYSTYRECAEHGRCSAGKAGKPYRICSPRGASASSDSTSTPDLDDGDAGEIQMDSKPTSAPGIDLSVYGALGTTIAAYIERRASEIATAIIMDAVKTGAMGARVHDFRVNGTTVAKVSGRTHKALAEIMELYAMGFRNFYVVGPAGSGKTTLAADLARALDSTRDNARGWAGISCSAGVSEGKIVGRAIPNLTTGATSYQGTDFVRMYECGGVFLFDEVDGSDPNMMLCIQSATANGHLSLVDRAEQPTATRHPDSVIICAANTWGTGTDRQYVGRNQLDAAFLDRFVGTMIEVDYDRDLERELVGDDSICVRVWSIRDRVSEQKLRRIVGTRFLLNVARMVQGGWTIERALRRATAGWTTDELSKVGVR